MALCLVLCSEGWQSPLQDRPESNDKVPTSRQSCSRASPCQRRTEGPLKLLFTLHWRPGLWSLFYWLTTFFPGTFYSLASQTSGPQTELWHCYLSICLTTCLLFLPFPMRRDRILLPYWVKLAQEIASQLKSSQTTCLNYGWYSNVEYKPATYFFPPLFGISNPILLLPLAGSLLMVIKANFSLKHPGNACQTLHSRDPLFLQLSPSFPSGKISHLPLEKKKCLFNFYLNLCQKKFTKTPQVRRWTSWIEIVSNCIPDFNKSLYTVEVCSSRLTGKSLDFISNY